MQAAIVRPGYPAARIRMRTQAPECSPEIDMIHLTRDNLLAGLLVLPSIAWADSPRLTGTSPLGVQRGLSTEVTFEGSGLGDGTRLIAPFGFEIEEPTGS